MDKNISYEHCQTCDLKNVQYSSEITKNLINRGYISNVSDPNISENILKQWKSKCNICLNENGYDGGYIEKIESINKNSNNIYTLFNTTNFNSYLEQMDIIKKLHKEY